METFLNWCVGHIELIIGLIVALIGVLGKLSMFQSTKTKLVKARAWANEHDVDVSKIIEDANTFENYTNDQKRTWAAKQLCLVAKDLGFSLNQTIAELIIDSAYRVYKRVAESLAASKNTAT